MKAVTSAVNNYYSDLTLRDTSTLNISKLTTVT